MKAVSEQTPSQTVGPFFGLALPYHGGPDVVAPWRGDAITLQGTVFDGAGVPVTDAMLEIWQADGSGELRGRPGSLARDGVTFTGFGRAATDGAGNYVFHTVRPGTARTAEGSPHAPHLALVVFARGVTLHLFTRIYFADAAEENGTDPLLRSLPTDRAETLLAQRLDDGSYSFDVHLQGDRETVFLDLIRGSREGERG